MVLIQPAGSEEATLIADLSRKTFQETFGESNTEEDMNLFLSTQFTTEVLEADTRLPHQLFFIAWEEKEPLGYLKLKKHLRGYPNLDLRQPVLEISRIYVVKSALGKGIGQSLMNKAFSVAQTLEMKAIVLGVWELNARAIAFYLKNGFEKAGTHPFLLGNDLQTDWLMVKKY